MRAICSLVGTCAIALLVAACGTTLGAEEEGLELLPGPPLAVEQPPEPAPPVEPLAPEELEQTPPLAPPPPLAELPDEPVETVEEPRPPNPFVEAVQLLLSERSVRIAVAATTVIQTSGRELSVQSDGIYDLTTFTGTIDIDAVNLGRALGSDASLAGSFIPSQMVFVDNRVFLDYTALAEVSSAQSPWAVARYRQLFGAGRWPDQGAVSSLALATPAHVAALLNASRKTLVEVGKEPIRGASTTHYQAVADLGTLPAAAPEQTRGLLRGQARELAAALGFSELPLDIWIDDRGRVRRVSVDLGALVAGTPDAAPADAGDPATADPADASTAPAPDDPATTADPALDSALDPALDPALATEQAARALEGEAAVSEPGPPSAVLVIDFITFAGRAVAEAPAAADTGAYADVARFAQAVEASLDA